MIDQLLGESYWENEDELKGALANMRPKHLKEYNQKGPEFVLWDPIYIAVTFTISHLRKHKIDLSKFQPNNFTDEFLSRLSHYKNYLLSEIEFYIHLLKEPLYKNDLERLKLENDVEKIFAFFDKLSQMVKSKYK